MPKLKPEFLEAFRSYLKLVYTIREPAMAKSIIRLLL